MICDKCGVELVIGMYPFCPHPSGSQTVIADDIPGGMLVENGFDHPTMVYSHSEHRAKLAANGYVHRIKNAGPDDKLVPRWDTVDLEAAKALLERGPQARRAKVDRSGDAVITVTELGAFSGKDLDAD